MNGSLAEFGTIILAANVETELAKEDLSNFFTVIIDLGQSVRWVKQVKILKGN